MKKAIVTMKNVNIELTMTISADYFISQGYAPDDISFMRVVESLRWCEFPMTLTSDDITNIEIK